MNIWFPASIALIVALIPCAVTTLRGSLLDRLAGLELTGVVMAQLFVLLAVGMDRVAFVDLGLAATLLTFGGGLVFARFLERWL